MSTVVVTSAEVFSDSDVERPCALIGRIGGGTYVVQLVAGGQTVDKSEAADYDAAVAAADKHAGQVDAEPTTADEKINLSRTIKEQAATIADLEAQIEALQKPPTALDVATDLKG